MTPRDMIAKMLCAWQDTVEWHANERLDAPFYHEADRILAALAADGCEIVAAGEIEQLRDEISTWKSVFPEIAPESVLPDRSLLEAEVKSLRAELLATEKVVSDLMGGYERLSSALGKISILAFDGASNAAVNGTLAQLVQDFAYQALLNEDNIRQGVQAK